MAAFKALSHEMLAPTVIGSTVAYVIVYALSIFFIVFYLRQATFRNVATDNMSWLAVYALIALLVVYSMLTNGVHGISTEIDPVQIRAKGWLCVTLAFGAFFYPTFWELLDYNEQNEDGTKQISMTRPFIMGGLLFGFYLLFVLAGAFTTYSPTVDLLKGVLVALVAVSSLSSFLYGSMVNFGKKLGVIVDIAAVASSQVNNLNLSTPTASEIAQAIWAEAPELDVDLDGEKVGTIIEPRISRIQGSKTTTLNRRAGLATI